MSHKTMTLPLNQAISFLKKESLYASVSRDGIVHASIYHYVYRSDDLDTTNLNYWKFISSQEICKLRVEKSLPAGENGVTQGRQEIL